MSERREGWYWVKMNCGLWTVAQLCEGVYVSIDGEWDDENEMVIGQRIPSPDEPWATVPVNPTREMVLDGAWQCPSDVDEVMESCAEDTWTAMLAAAPQPENS